MICSGARKRIQDYADKQGKQSAEVGEELANVVAAATEDREMGASTAAPKVARLSAQGPSGGSASGRLSSVGE